MDSSSSDQANAQAGSASGVSGQDNSQGSIGIDAFGGRGGAYSTQSTAGIQSTKGDMAGGSMSITDPSGRTTTYSPTQVPALEIMNPVPYDIFGIVNKVNQNLRDRDAQGLYSQVTRDAMGNVTGSFNNAPMFGLGFMPNVTTYTGFDPNPYNEDMSMSGGESEAIKPASTNPVS